MFAVIATGTLNLTSCHPVGVSFVNVAVVSNVPLSVHNEPVCVPTFPEPL